WVSGLYATDRVSARPGSRQHCCEGPRRVRFIQAPEARSLPRNPALHGAVNPGPQKGNLGLAVEWPERRLQQPGAKAGCPDGFDWRALGLVPGNAEAIVRHGP